MIQEYSIERLRDLISLMEDERFVKAFVVLLVERQNKHINSLINENNDETRGAIKELGWVTRLHDVAIDELQKKLIVEEAKKRNLESDVDSNTAAA